MLWPTLPLIMAKAVTESFVVICVCAYGYMFQAQLRKGAFITHPRSYPGSFSLSTSPPELFKILPPLSYANAFQAPNRQLSTNDCILGKVSKLQHHSCTCQRFAIDEFRDHLHICSQHAGATTGAHEHILTGVGKERLGPSYFFHIISPRSSKQLLWYVPS